MKKAIQSSTDIPLPEQTLYRYMKNDHGKLYGLHKENENERINRIS